MAPLSVKKSYNPVVHHVRNPDDPVHESLSLGDFGMVDRCIQSQWAIIIAYGEATKSLEAFRILEAMRHWDKCNKFHLNQI